MSVDILNTLALERTNHKEFDPDIPVDEDHVKSILRSAAGITPALCNEYNYRVDVVPDNLKQVLFENGKFVSDVAVQASRLDCAFEIRYQYLAPLLLVWSMKENQNETHKNKMIGPLTELFANHIGIGMSVWHTVLTAVSLGYDTSITGAIGAKKEILKKNILGLHHDSETDVDKFYPVMFLSVGKGVAVSDQHRVNRYENIINTLGFNDA